ncbi:uncharacterized protein LOC109706671 [Ananas comosus]|uniref:Uncharacterized protein LOC109706671 n=1 Tax=Ananas comosus TaxID=4615 RepID=A0A199UNB2_ANACO|nr:uncharacterized protein LOC109706671 [Ananas comosus]OAY66136.1 hypothetical protein ACMD2_05869 [Ananas comosus]
MSVAGGLECVVCVGCSRWAWKRLNYVGTYDSESWPLSSAAEFAPIPRACRAILGVYADDLADPSFAPSLDPSSIVKRVPYADTHRRCPPYLIYADRPHKELVLAIRGLSLTRNSDYMVLLDDGLGMQVLDGGFVHRGLLRAATWILDQEADTLRRLLQELGPDYKLVFAGHSLGSGIAALMTVIVVNNRDQFGGIPRSHIHGYAVAPARCMSLNLAIKYADVVTSVILQDDFLPRTTTPLQYIFGSIFCLPCLLFFACLRDTFISEKKKLSDPRRLYTPGRIYHIVERKLCRCGRLPPEVRTAIPVEGRFEHLVLSCNTTSDHAILWIEREAQKAADLMQESGEPTSPPQKQKMERIHSLEQEHRIALERAETLKIPHAVAPTEESSTESIASDNKSSNSGGKTKWDELTENLFTKSASGSLVLKKDILAKNGD